MANSEQSFADRLGRADTMVEAIKAAEPDFSPADNTITPAAFEMFVADLEMINDEANAANGEYSTAVRERVAMVKDIKGRALRAFRYVLSNQAWEHHAGSIKLTYDKLRDNQPKPTPLPVEGTAGEVTRAIKTGEQSFADIDSLFTKFVVGLSKIAAYTPPADELTLVKLQALNASFSALNKSMAGLAETASLKIRKRQAGFADLKTKATAIKNAASSQYGMKSATYASIKGLRF
jgi:hypothetical protein